MNTNLLISALLVFSSLPTFAMGQRPDFIVVQTATLANIEMQKLQALETAGIISTKNDVITVNFELLRDLIERSELSVGI